MPVLPSGLFRWADTNNHKLVNQDHLENQTLTHAGCTWRMLAIVLSTLVTEQAYWTLQNPQQNPGVGIADTSPDQSNPGSLLIQEVVKLPLEFVRQLSIKVQHERPGKSLLAKSTRTHGDMLSNMCVFCVGPQGGAATR